MKVVSYNLLIIHTRTEFLTFLLQFTEFLLAPIHIALVFEIFIFKPEHFSELFNIWMKIYKEDMFATIAVATNKYRKSYERECIS